MHCLVFVHVNEEKTEAHVLNVIVDMLRHPGSGLAVGQVVNLAGVCTRVGFLLLPSRVVGDDCRRLERLLLALGITQNVKCKLSIFILQLLPMHDTTQSYIQYIHKPRQNAVADARFENRRPERERGLNYWVYIMMGQKPGVSSALTRRAAGILRRRPATGRVGRDRVGRSSSEPENYCARPPCSARIPRRG